MNMNTRDKSDAELAWESNFDRILRLPEVKKFTGFTNSALAREIEAGRFPKPFKLSTEPNARANGWSMNAVQAWISERKSA